MDFEMGWTGVLVIMLSLNIQWISKQDSTTSNQIPFYENSVGMKANFKILETEAVNYYTISIWTFDI
jgi:hypothetical protein